MVEEIGKPIQGYETILYYFKIMGIPRLGIFALPNGSGKSTDKTFIPERLLGHYLNPEEIEKEVKNNDYFDLRGRDTKTNREEVVTFFSNYPLIEKT